LRFSRNNNNAAVTTAHSGQTTLAATLHSAKIPRMKRHRRAVLLIAVVAVAILATNCSASDKTYRGAYADRGAYEGSEADRAAIRKTGDAIRAAFARGDVDGIMAYHHPDVIKALTPGSDYQIGSDAVRAGLMQTLQSFSLHFDQSHVDNLFFEGNTAVEESSFAVRGTPKANAQPFVFKGRSLAVYVR
jgi:ketosteroid isomerase-like protein